MKRVVLALLGTVTGLVMLLSFKTHAVTAGSVPAAVAAGPGETPTADPTASSGPDTGSGAASSDVSSAPSAAPSSSASSASSSDGTYTGDAADTRYGPVQVQITVTDGKVSAAQAVEYPQNDPRDYEINSYAVPQLNSEATASGSAQIDVVSGATYTSDGYIASLQSALDQAGL